MNAIDPVNSEALKGFADGVAEKAEPEGGFMLVLAPTPQDDPPADIERPVRDREEWRPLAEVEAEAAPLVLVTPLQFDRETWTTPETPGAVPPEPDFAQ